MEDEEKINIDLRETQAQIDWLKQKLYLNTRSENAKERIVMRGQVHFCELGVGVGSEMQKKRPCVIIQNDVGNARSATTTIVPITHTTKSLKCFVPVKEKYDTNGRIILNGSVNVSAIRSIDKARIGNHICDLETSEMKEVDKAIALNMDIFKHYKTLQNMYDDKLVYIEKLNAVLKEAKELLGVDDNKKIIEELKKVLDKP